MHLQEGCGPDSGAPALEEQTYCRYEANFAPRDQEEVATIVWKTLLHTQLPRDCRDGGGETVGAMLVQRIRL